MDAMSDEDWLNWTREHQVRYEIGPLMEMDGGRQVQVGFEFEIAARMPSAGAEGQSRRHAIRDVQVGLKKLAEHAFPAEGEVARYEIAPLRAMAQLPSSPTAAPEVRITVRAFHKADYFQSVAEGDRRRLSALEQRLKELGVKSGK